VFELSRHAGNLVPGGKAAGSFLVHDDAGGYRPLNWIRTEFRSTTSQSSQRMLIDFCPTRQRCAEIDPGGLVDVQRQRVPTAAQVPE
jgi:hypothetical protein